MRKASAILLASVLLLSACAQTHQPIVDLKGQDSARYQNDLFECRQLAEQRSPAGDAAIGGLGGAAAGAGVGALSGALVHGGNVGRGALIGSVAGGLLGVTAGAVTGMNDQRQIIDNCLRGRGYNVVN